MSTRAARLALPALLALAVLLAGCADPAGAPSPTATPNRTPGRTPTAALAPGVPRGAERATVDWITDGDTIDVVLPGGGQERVRLTGVDAPETHPNNGEPVQCFGTEATALLIAWIPKGTIVWLERDITDRDRYGRLLRYVWVEEAGDALLINERLVRAGGAIAHAYEPDTTYARRFERAQATAEAEGAGLWGACGGVVPLTGQAPPTATASARMGIAVDAGGERAGCDPAYPTVCIPPAPPDLDCPEVPFTRFPVLPPDPHGFDVDRDGLGCESQRP